MRYAVVSDVHSNLEALESVLEAVAKKNVDSCVCAGDIVGYGADPAECVRLVRENFSITVCGNHDRGVFDDSLLEWFNEDAKEAIIWTRENLDSGEVEFLKQLELKSAGDDFTLVHSSALFPGEWKYIDSVESASGDFQGFDGRVCFAGHTHKPVVFTLNEKTGSCRFARETLTPVLPHLKYIINTGSAGQPRDGDPRAAFAVFDTGRMEAEIIRTDYDIGAARRKIVEAGLPGIFADRLGRGL